MFEITDVQDADLEAWVEATLRHAGYKTDTSGDLIFAKTAGTRLQFDVIEFNGFRWVLIDTSFAMSPSLGNDNILAAADLANSHSRVGRWVAKANPAFWYNHALPAANLTESGLLATVAAMKSELKALAGGKDPSSGKLNTWFDDLIAGRKVPLPVDGQSRTSGVQLDPTTTAWLHSALERAGLNCHSDGNQVQAKGIRVGTGDGSVDLSLMGYTLDGHMWAELSAPLFDFPGLPGTPLEAQEMSFRAQAAVATAECRLVRATARNTRTGGLGVEAGSWVAVDDKDPNRLLTTVATFVAEADALGGMDGRIADRFFGAGS